MKKAAVGVLILLLLVLGATRLPSCTSTYLGRYLLWNVKGITDYTRFPYREIKSSPSPSLFTQDPALERAYARYFTTVDYTFMGMPVRKGFEDFLRATGTTAFIVVKDDSILYEKYLNGARRDSLCRALSISKSVTSALVGIAIDEGAIHGVYDPMTVYLRELRGKGLDAIRIRHLLMMDSGLRFRSGYMPWYEEPRSFYEPHLRRLVLTDLHPEEPPGKLFHYDDYHAALLGIILERTVGRSPSRYLEDMVWRDLGTEYPALWSLNSTEDGLESLASGLNARAIDLARFGSLYLHHGIWNGRRIVPEKWVVESTSPETGPPGYYPDWYARQGIYYKYLWWGHDLGGGRYNFYALGLLGQMIYVCPEKHLVIVRCGTKLGELDYGWDGFARHFTSRLP